MYVGRFVLVLALGASCVLGCGGGQAGQPTTPSAVANQRLQGNWHLVGFAPSLELEPPLKSLLDAQLQTLNISFMNGEFTATGPGVDTGGRYEITDATSDSLTGRVFDRAGAVTASPVNSSPTNSASTAPTPLGRQRRARARKIVRSSPGCTLRIAPLQIARCRLHAADCTLQMHAADCSRADGSRFWILVNIGQ